MNSVFVNPGVIHVLLMLFWKSLRICFFHIYQIYLLGGGHWGALETAKPKRKSSKTAKPQKNSAKTENRIRNRHKTDTMVTSGAYRANCTNTLFNQSIFGCHGLL